MAVIDVDSHWEIAEFSAGDDPFGPWRDELPDDLTVLAYGMLGDALRALPPERRPDTKTCLSGMVKAAEQNGGPVILHPVHQATADDRVQWMDNVGIDHCLVNPGGYWLNLEWVKDDRLSAIQRCNDFLADRLSDHKDRLHGVAIVDFSDLTVAVKELQRARALGHRGFFLYTVDGRPPSATPPGHPDWDTVWSAAVDLGMIASIHIGNTATDYTTWADIGWNHPNGSGIGGLARIANTQRQHAAQDLVSSMLFGGAFHRHPNVTVILEEMKVGWLPWYVQNMTGLAREGSEFVFNHWPYGDAGDMLRRNLKFTPLPGFGDIDALEVVAKLPEMALFSSDFPHQEGNPDPINLYGSGLDELDPTVKDQFLGANAVEMFSRTGNPL